MVFYPQQINTMKTKQQKLDKLMEAMSDKTLSFGCKCRNGWYSATATSETFPSTEWINNYILSHLWWKIIWHPVYLHNVLMFFRNKWMDIWYSKYWYEIVPDLDNLMICNNIKRDLSKDLYWQSDETINKLFELLSHLPN